MRAGLFRLLNWIFFWYRAPRFAEVRVAKSASVDWVRVRGGSGCRLIVGEHSIVKAALAFERPGATIEIGNRTFIGRSGLVAAQRISIGDDVLVAWSVTICDHGSHAHRFSLRAGDVLAWGRGKKDWAHVVAAQIEIRDKAWVGFNAIILKGVSVGEGAIVAPGAVVTSRVRPWTVVAGNPARVVHELGEDER